jgi:hypothetical protein
MIWLAALVLAIWLGLVATGFWTCREADDNAPLPRPTSGLMWSPSSRPAMRPM